jgi:hypothetical protein
MQDSGNQLRTFTSAREFRAWLRAHHRSATELLVRCYKVGAKDRGLTSPRVPGIEAPEARIRLPEEAPSQRTRLALLPGSGAVVSAHQHFLGDGGKT